jgi:hypothetical protein
MSISDSLRQFGKATVIALQLNNDNIVAARSIWLEFSWHPPSDD